MRGEQQRFEGVVAGQLGDDVAAVGATAVISGLPPESL
jgi:hypothetical protein